MRKIGICLLTIATCWACSNSGGKKVTPGGYEYIVYHDESGSIPDPGNVVYFTMEIMDPEGNVLFDYKNTDTYPSIQIPAEGDNNLRTNPIMDLLKTCSVGDSIGLIIPKDSIPQQPPEYADLEYFQYIVNVEEILTAEENQVRINQKREADAAKMAVVSQRAEEVSTLLQETIDRYNKNGLGEALKEDGNGLKYIVHEEGKGKLPEIGKRVSVQYYGALTDGSSFDNSFRQGLAYTFTLGRGEVIQGWDLIVAQLKEGSKATVFIPSQFGYGERGSPPQIPANAELVFYVEIEKAF